MSINMNVKDNITATWKDDVWNYKNTEFRNTGFEASVAVEASDKFSYDVGLTIHNPENKVDNEPSKVGWQRKFGKYQMKGGLEYKLEKFKAGFTGSYVVKIHTIKTGDHRRDRQNDRHRRQQFHDHIQIIGNNRSKRIHHTT